MVLATIRYTILTICTVTVLLRLASVHAHMYTGIPYCVITIHYTMCYTVIT